MHDRTVYAEDPLVEVTLYNSHLILFKLAMYLLLLFPLLSTCRLRFNNVFFFHLTQSFPDYPFIVGSSFLISDGNVPAKNILGVFL